MVLSVYFSRILCVFSFILELWYFKFVCFYFRIKYDERSSLWAKEWIKMHD